MFHSTPTEGQKANSKMGCDGSKSVPPSSTEPPVLGSDPASSAPADPPAAEAAAPPAEPAAPPAEPPAPATHLRLYERAVSVKFLKQFVAEHPEVLGMHTWEVVDKVE